LKIPTIHLLPAKEKAIKRGHPWVFSGALDKHSVKPGEWAELCDHNGRFLALGFVEPGSIAFKIAAREIFTPEELIRFRIEKAIEFRRKAGLLNKKENEIIRLFFAEGDGLPGLVVDAYGKHCVVQFHSRAVFFYRHLIAEILADQGFPNVFSKSKESLHDKGIEDSYLLGGKQEDVFLENGLKFKVDWELGQKTGFFIDQRENRRLLGTMSEGKKVLNAFSYTGGFSIYALAGGASEVVSLDSSAKAIALANENASINGFESKHSGIIQDAFEYLKDMPTDFDVVVLDPPAFAKSQRVTHNAVQAYKRINSMAMEKMTAGSQLLSFSCSQHISRELFTSTLRAAAIDCGRSVRLVQHLQQPVDHPSNLVHPEGEYLKGLWLQVD
jgi:23S rRNA (cytosine1962-C5)-methyltransferase